jgi:hypothetical protein
MTKNVMDPGLQEELQTAHDAIVAARWEILAGSDQTILRATVSGMLIGLETQVLAIKASFSLSQKKRLERLSGRRSPSRSCPEYEIIPASAPELQPASLFMRRPKAA